MSSCNNPDGCSCGRHSPDKAKEKQEVLDFLQTQADAYQPGDPRRNNLIQAIRLITDTDQSCLDFDGAKDDKPPFEL